jgi:hypothetical protein
MCASLLHPERATTEELEAAIKRKVIKFGSLQTMPSATAYLVQKALTELKARPAGAVVMPSGQANP